MSHRMFSIEVRIDFTDDRKHDAVVKIMQMHAEQIHAAVGLLRDHTRPMVTIYSHDHSRGHVDIPLRADKSPASGEASEADLLAAELAEAFK